eukprot:Hpha_TRINITY_DN3079_c0_g1::TRINITY_DN3079_c0_g1_i1::g.138512::m.138512
MSAAPVARFSAAPVAAPVAPVAHPSAAPVAVPVCQAVGTGCSLPAPPHPTPGTRPGGYHSGATAPNPRAQPQGSGGVVAPRDGHKVSPPRQPETEEEMLQRAMELSKLEYERKQRGELMREELRGTSVRVVKDAVPATTPGAKGLDNTVTAHHCFINVALQAMMQLGQFRTAVLQAAHECPSTDSPGQCLLCEVRYLMQSNRRTSDSYLSPQLVRTVLEQVGCCEEGKMADASEIFGALVKGVCDGISSRTPDDPTNRVFIPGVTDTNLLTVADFLSTLRSLPEGSAGSTLTQLLQVSLSLPELPFLPKVVVLSPVWNNFKYREGHGDIKRDVQDFTAQLDSEINLEGVYGPAGEG